MKLDIPQFSLNEKLRMFMINSGKYNRTQFKYQNTKVEDGVLSYVVEFNEFWIDGGKVTNAHESELLEFINGPALDILENIIEAMKIEQAKLQQ